MSLEPSRIALARLRAGLSKVELARKLDATTRTVTNYESTGAPDKAAPAIAAATGCTVTYLSLPATRPLEEERVFFRARRQSTAAQKHAATAAGRTGVELYELITQHFALPTLELPDLSTLEPSAAAVQLRAEWQLGLDPLPNLIQLAESKGIRVLSLPHATANVDAFSLWENSFPYVFLSTVKTAERSRFDLAHEIGHLVMHGGLSQSDGDERNAEREADQFASAFLMPPASLRAVLPHEPSVETIMQTKSHFKVSAMALTYSAHKAGLLTDWSYRQACTELTSRGFRTGEPEGMPREASRVFKFILPALHKSKGWRTEEIAHQLGVSPAEVHGITFGQAIALLNSASIPATSTERSRSHLSLVT